MQPNKSPLGYQLIDKNLEDVLFKGSEEKFLSTVGRLSLLKHLKKFDIDPSQTPTFDYAQDFKLPEYIDTDAVSWIDKEVEKKFKPLKDQLINFIKSKIPEAPNTILDNPHWTRYEKVDDEWKIDRVSHPIEKTFVIDVETYVQMQNYPIMATAYSDKAVYVWLHPSLMSKDMFFKPELISVGKGKLMINHNIKFDTAHFKETYELFPQERNYYFCTMSAHISICGMSTKQRTSYLMFKSGKANYAAKWCNATSPNNLVDVYNFHFKPMVPLTSEDKLTRNMFVNGHLPLFRDNLDELIEYNLKDVEITFELAKALVPKYFNHKPNLITFAAHLTCNRSILPVVNNWEEWVAKVTQIYNLKQKELVNNLTAIAKKHVVKYMKAVKEKDVGRLRQILENEWLKHLDWTPAKSGKSKGEPAWWRKIKKKGVTLKSRLAPYLLEIKWDGFAISFVKNKGWCYEVEETTPKAFTAKDSNDIVRFYLKVPHPKGDKQNCGNPLGKSYIPHLDTGMLSSSNPDSKEFLLTAKSLSYWAAYESRVLGYRATDCIDIPNCKLIEPTYVVHGTASNRSVEKTWLTASKVKKAVVGSELKSRIQSPSNPDDPDNDFVFVRSDEDQEEVKIAAAFSDAFRSGFFGSTPMSFTALFGDKSNHTDSHSLLTIYLGLDVLLYRDNVGKPLNFSMIYLSGVSACTQTIHTARPDLSLEECKKMANLALTSRRGKKNYGRGGSYVYEGGTDSDAYNFMLALGDSVRMPDHVSHLKTNPPRTPALESQMSDAITIENCGKDYLTSRANWGVQSSGVDILHIFNVVIEILYDKHEIKGRALWNIHDEFITLVKRMQALQGAMCFQIAHLLVWSYFFKKLGFNSMPYNYAWFSEVDIDTTIRKDVNNSVLTISNNVEVEKGVSYSIKDLLELGVKL